MLVRALIPVVSAVALLVPARAQNPPAPQYAATAEEVMVDIVARDKKGRLVRDLKPEQIEVLEDGAPQKLRSLEFIEPQAAKDPLRQLRFVSIVFQFQNANDVDAAAGRRDSSSVWAIETKRLARQGVRDLLGLATEPSFYFSLYTIDQNLHLLQNFSTDHDALNREMERNQTLSYPQFLARSNELIKTLQPKAAEAAADPKNVDARMAKVQLESLALSQNQERGEIRRATLFSLISLVQAQAQLPGRKAVVYFTDSFNVPVELVPLFRSLVSAANRANVALYCIDARGLRMTSQMAQSREKVASVARNSADQATTLSRLNADYATPDQIKMDGAMQEGLRANVQSQLGELANDTGGAVVSETNDFKPPLRRALEELRGYYEASYKPQAAAMDGTFRRLAVRSTRSDVVLRARAGYLAVPPGKEMQQVFAYETPLLAVLGQAPLPQALEFRSGALRFNPRGAQVQYTLAIDVPMKGIEFRANNEKKAAFAHASVLAVVKNEKGDVVSKFSQDFPRQVPLDKVDAFRNGSLIQTYRASLPPGKYAFETAVADQNANKVAGQRAELVVPQPGPALALSSVCLIRRVDPIQGQPDPDDPFATPTGKIIPEISTTVQGGPGRQVSFYFVVYLNSGKSDAPELTMSFYQSGQFLGASKPALGKPDKEGRIPYIASVRGEAFPPGQYEMRASVKQGAETAEDKVAFTVQ